MKEGMNLGFRVSQMGNPNSLLLNNFKELKLIELIFMFNYQFWTLSFILMQTGLIIFEEFVCYFPYCFNFVLLETHF